MHGVASSTAEPCRGARRRRTSADREAGARVLEEGGNAVDACIAAAFASWVAESPLTGPGAGGFMLVHRARDGRRACSTSSSRRPGLGRASAAAPRWTRSTSTSAARRRRRSSGSAPRSCAVPGAAPGSPPRTAPTATLPWPELLAPAIELARDGVELTRAQAYLHAILDLILRHTEEGRRVYGGGRARLGAGDTLAPAGARRHDRAARAHGARPSSTRGELGRAIVAHVREAAAITHRRPARLPRDLAPPGRASVAATSSCRTRRRRRAAS